ncbi:MAG: orotidine-5'-phosphate decarboxylase [Proteobacteria bacterium]|jgi:orotidine-5'-phosphate decarboxylase|nr:orotidine-5'-phosphate decarboxylase [Pseudomonadota bacterium]
MNKVDAAEARRRLILALDVPDIASGIGLLERLEGRIGLVKVGLELFTACGPAAVEAVRRRGFDVFLDLKLHDIPATVAGAVRSARGLGVAMLTVHTGGGAEMLSRAAEEAGEAIRILGVTLLTSLGAEDLPAVSVSGTPSEVVARRAALAAAAGCGGIVCSPKEVRVVREAAGPAVAIVTPGIRPAGAELGDQKRAATPTSAIADGADYLVVGRPIHGAPDPASAAGAIVEEIRRALAARPA